MRDTKIESASGFGRLMIAATIGVAGALGGGCEKKQAGPTAAMAPQAVPVTVATVMRQDMPVEILAVGNVEPMASVTLKPQVDGQIMEAKFVDGQEVQAGDLMIEIDARPYAAALAELQAKLAKDTVVAEDAERAARQMAEALKGRAMSQRESEKARADAEAAKAQMESDRAEIAAAQLKIEYCSIRSPITGRAGALMVKPGNVVEANKTELAVVNQIAPIYVTFAVPEQNLGAVQAHQAEAPLTVQTVIPGHAGGPIAGSLAFVDNKVDMTTGTIRLKAEFGNDDRALWPGQFVNVVVTVSTQRGAMVVPASAVQPGQKGTFVFVVKADKTVDQRAVVVSRTVSGQSVIAEGLTEGETVVSDGQLRLVPGALVEVNTAARVPERKPA